MKVFQCRVRDETGRALHFERAGHSATAVEGALRNEGYLVLGVQAAKGGRLGNLRSTRTKPTSILALLRELRIVLGAGLNVSEALNMVAERAGDEALTRVLHEVNADIRRGTPVAQAIRARAATFEPALATTFQIGVSSGNLAGALERYEQDLEMRVELQRKFRKALTYPVFLLGLLAIVLVILFVFILPNFVDLYDEFGAELPAPTRLLLSLVAAAPFWLAAAAAGCFVAWGAQKLLRRSEAGALWLDKLAFGLPIYGRLRREGYRAQIASGLSLLLYSGMPLLGALKLVREALDTPVMAKKLGAIEAGIAKGGRLSMLAQDVGLFTGTAKGLLQVAEKTGTPDEMLFHVAKLHERALADRVDFVTALIEPIMMVMIGGVIGAIVIVVYLPIFGVTNVIQ